MPPESGDCPSGLVTFLRAPVSIYSALRLPLQKFLRMPRVSIMPIIRHISPVVQAFLHE